ncbi:MAG: hypothetical protein Q8S73_26275 [Deltaproteobacteria bacterium]|nr:hypothetical protein [Deltaproteobacteria bacterium]
MARRAKKSPVVIPLRGASPRPRSSSVEWAGTRLAAPPGLAVRDVDALDFIFWMHGPHVVAAVPVDRDAPPGALADVLRKALASLKGALPQRLRVSDAAAAPAVVALVGPDIPVSVGPVPEALDALAEFAEVFAGVAAEQAVSPLEEIVDLADQDPALVGRFFTAGAALYKLGPWNLVPSDSDVLRVDAPALGLHGACISVVGQIGQSYGVLCFDSAERFMAFRRRAEHVVVPGEAMAAIPPSIAVNFEKMSEFPPDFRKELRRRRWPLAGPSGVPWLMCSSPSGAPRSITRADVLTATVLMEVLTTFLAKHGESIFDMLAQCVERYEVAVAKGKVAVTVEHPHPAYEDDDFDDLDDDAPEFDARDTVEEMGTARFLHPWKERYIEEHPDELEAALREVGFAVLGRTFTRDDGPRLSMHLGSSLVPTWTALFRPRKNGQTGLDAAASDRSLADASSRSARLRLSQARVIFCDVLAVDLAAGTVLVEDAFDHTRYTVLGWGSSQLGQLTRWARCFGLVIPREDGRWIFPSVFSVGDHFSKVDPGRFVAAVNAAVTALKKPGVAVDPAAPAAGLRRYWGVAYGVLVRMGEEILAAQKPKRTFLSTTEGDCVEFHEVVVKMKATVATVASRMRAAGDMVEVGDRQWSWMAGAPDPLAPIGEALGSLEREASRWVVKVNSAARVTRMFDRIEAIVGERPKVVSRSMTAPWQEEEHVVRTKEEADETMVISNRPVAVGSPEEGLVMAADLTQRALRDALDRELSAVGGVPRQRVATEEGRAAVEAWLRELELKGQAPEGPGGKMLDLDPIRRELGIPAVVGIPP